MALGGDILIKLGADVAELRTGFDAARKEMSAFGKQAEKFGSHFKEVIVSALGAFSVASLANFAKASAKIADDFGELAESMGLSTDQFQAFRAAAEQGGVGAEGFTTAFTKFNRAVGDAGLGVKTAIEKFTDLGVHIVDMKGKLIPTADAAGDVANAILEMDDKSKQAAATLSLFGRGSAKMINVLKDLAAGASEVSARMASRGGIVSPEDIKKLDDFNDKIALTSRILEAQAATAFANLIPNIDGVLDKMEALGQKFVKLSEVMAPSGGGSTGIRAAFGGGVFTKFVEDALDELDKLIQFFIDLPDHIKRGFAQAQVFVLDFFVFISENLIDTTGAFETWLNNWVNGWARAINKVVAIILDMNPIAAKFIGILGVPTAIPEIKIEINTTEAQQELNTLKKERDALSAQASLPLNAATQDEATIGARRRRKIGVSDPAVNDHGAAAAKIQKLLDELVGRQKAEEEALAQFRDKATSAPLEELQKQIDLQKKVDEAISKFKADNVGIGSAVVEKVRAQFLATESAVAATKDFVKAMQDAEQISRQFGDGSATLTTETKKLDEAFATQKLTILEYNAALKSATDTQIEQSLKARGAVEGLDAVSAGFEHALLQFQKSNDSFAQGGQIFGGIIDAMSSAISEFQQSGTIDFGKLLGSFSAMLTKMALMAAASEVFNLFTGKGSGSGRGTDGLFSSIGDLLGGLFSGGGRAGGGLTTPGMSYTVGEHGPEQFVPSVAGRIEPAGSSSWNNGSVTVNVDMGQTKGASDPNSAMEFGRKIKSAVQDVISNEKRPGGSLYARA